MYIKIKFTDGKWLRGYFFIDNVKIYNVGIAIYTVGGIETLYPWSIIRKVYIKPQKDCKGGRV